MGRWAKGFSLLELMVVIGLILLLSAWAVPSIRKSVSSGRLRTAANQLTAELNYARTIATSRNAVFQVQFNSDSGTYQIVDPADPYNPPRPVKSLDSGISFVSSPGSLKFYPRANAEAGTIQLQNEFSEFVTIDVLVTGIVDVQDIG